MCYVHSDSLLRVYMHWKEASLPLDLVCVQGLEVALIDQ